MVIHRWFMLIFHFGCSFGFKSFIRQPLHELRLAGFEGPPWCHPEAAAQMKLVPSLNYIKFYSSGRNDRKQETLTDRRSSCHCSGGVLSLLKETQVNGQLSASLVATVPVLTAQNAMPFCCRACHGMSLGSNGFKLLQQIAKGMDTDRLTPSASLVTLD